MTPKATRRPRPTRRSHARERRQLEYSEAGEIAREIDQSEATATVRDYDALGKETTVSQPNETALASTYTASGELAGLEATANTVNPVCETYSYDTLGNQTASVVTTDTTVPAATTEAEYDSSSRMTSLTDRKDMSLSFSYDNLGNLTQILGSVSGTYQSDYVYDAGSNLTDLYFDGDSHHWTMGMDSAKRRTSISKGNLRTDYAYDRASKITSLTTSYSGSTLAHYEHVFDERGNITSVTDGTATTSYSYDSLSRLVGVTNPDSSTVAYAYDDLGNRLSRKRSGEASTTYVYDEANQLTSETRPDGEYITYSYDANGNLVMESSNATESPVTVYSYDPKNRLAKVTKPNGDTNEFVYDGLGNRSEKRVNGVSTFYAYDAQGNILLEYDTNLTVKVRYIRDPNTGRAIAMEQAGSLYNFICNEHGDVTKIANSSGTVVASYQYDEFGNETSSTGTLYNPLRYSGGNNAYFDVETGLYKMGARCYDPEIGRWITRDESAGDEQKAQSQNKYAYVEGNPVNKADSTSHWADVVHKDWTRTQAKKIGYKYRESVAQGAADLDLPYYSVANPVHVKWHFGQLAGGGNKNDSRWVYYQQAWSSAMDLLKRGRPGQASKQLGMGLHAYPQDYIARGWISPGDHWGTYNGVNVMPWGYHADNRAWGGDPNFHPDQWLNPGRHGWPGQGKRNQTTWNLTRRLLVHFRDEAGYYGSVYLR